MAQKKDLLLFYDRPAEPCFLQKGDDKAVFQVPDNFYPDRFKGAKKAIGDRFGENAGSTQRIIPVRNIALPDLSLPKQLPYNAQFSLFLQKHREMSGKLIDVFMGMRNLEDFQSVCSYCQLHINPYMFNYCLSVAMLHRPDTKGLNPPTAAEVFPDKFMDPKVFRKAREVATTVDQGERIPINIPVNYTASDADPEQRLAYFREDIGLNLHHWHWHLVYPSDSANRAIVDKDRRGELFYYAHQQLIARYEIERFSNGMARTPRLSDLRAPIPEGYFPKLDSQVAGRSWPPRFANSIIRDLDRPVDLIKLDISTMETWRARLFEAIENQSIILPNGRTRALDEETGIDILGNLLESSIISLNRDYYGDYHNMGHVTISYAHDPDHRHLEPFGVMGDLATTMRDPTFYRWHSHIDDIFVMFKNKLPPYPTNRLDFPGMRVSSIRVEGPAGMNSFRTFWEQSTIDISRGLDFTPRGSLPARFTHLQHEEFEFVVDVNNTTGRNAMATVRIFMAPVSDESGKPFTFEQQRRFFIEMDKFTRELRPGSNTIRQRSVESSVTVPFSRTFTSQALRRGEAGSLEAAEFDFCGCGWPHYLLLPKGTEAGYPMVMFAMLTNWDEDRVEQDMVGTCNDAAAYCGVRDRKYPDRRAMGYPFDRPAARTVNRLSDFLTPNMAVRDCTVQFRNETRQMRQ